MIVVARPRVHLTLIDLSSATLRRYGGVGLVLDGPPIVTRSYQTDRRIGVTGPAVDRRHNEIIRTLLRQNTPNNSPAFEMSVDSAPPQHVGLGVGTALALSALVHASWWAGLEMDPLELQRRSGRGGASGVGVNGFFTGGAIWDGGHPASTTPVGWSPSSARSGRGPIPPVLARLDIPSEWRFTLILPESRARTSGVQEAEFFRKNTPITAAGALGALSLAYHGILPAVRERDLGLLREVAAQLHRTGFKKLEVERHGKVVVDLISGLLAEGIAAPFMSSMGPLVCAVTDADSRSVASARRLGEKCGARILGTFSGHNRGYERREVK